MKPNPYRRKDGTYVLPNPKTGAKVIVTATPYGLGSGRWNLSAVDERGWPHGTATAIIELPMSKMQRWAFLDMPVAKPKGQGYGLCLYLAAAMYAGDMGAKGIAAGALSPESRRVWEGLVKHGLAVQEGEEDYVLPAKAVLAFLRRTRRQR